MPDYQLRPYQQRAADAVRESWDAYDRVLVCSPTGTGKTRIAVSLIAEWDAVLSQRYGRPGRVLWLAHRDELIQQAAGEIEEATGVEPGIEKAAQTTAGTLLKPRVVAASVQTLQNEGRLRAVVPETFGMVVLDEAHHAPADSFSRILAAFGHAKILGVTATTDRTDEIALGKVFQDCAFDYRLPDAIDDGWCCGIRQQFIVLDDLDFSGVRVGDGDLSAEDFGRIIQEEGPLHRIARPAVELAENRQTMVFCPTVAVTRALQPIMERYAAKLGRRGVVAAWGAMDEVERGAAVRSYQSGEAQFLLNCALYVEGFDAPATAHIVIARPTKSRMRYEQMCGRGFRGGRLCPVEGKTDLLVTDLVGSTLKCKLVHAGDVLGGKYDAVVTDEVNRRCLEKSEGGEPADVMAELRRVLLEADELRRARRMEVIAEARYRRRTIDPFVLYDLAEMPAPGWHLDRPPTEAQLRTLQDQKVVTKGLSFFQAEQLIRDMRDRQARGECTLRQARQLQRFGYSPHLPFDEAKRILDVKLGAQGGKPNRSDFFRWRKRKQQQASSARRPDELPF